MIHRYQKKKLAPPNKKAGNDSEKKINVELEYLVAEAVALSRIDIMHFT